MTSFTVTDTGTWPVVLTADHVAGIFHRSVNGLKKACQRHRFQPAPFQNRPWLWRRSDVVRFIESGRPASLRRVS